MERCCALSRVRLVKYLSASLLSFLTLRVSSRFLPSCSTDRWRLKTTWSLGVCSTLRTEPDMRLALLCAYSIASSWAEILLERRWGREWGIWLRT